MHVRFDKMDVYFKTHNENRYLVLFDYGWFDKICTIKYLISEKKKKNGITDGFNHNFHNFEIIRIDSNNPLPIDKY